jgi:hypothetical protein
VFIVSFGSIMSSMLKSRKVLLRLLESLGEHLVYFSQNTSNFQNKQFIHFKNEPSKSREGVRNTTVCPLLTRTTIVEVIKLKCST